MKSKIIFFLVQYLIFHSQDNFARALVGRNVREATEGEFPSVVCILQQSNEPRRLQFDVKCTGTLITRYHVLSSEHCFVNIGPRGVYILAGSIDLRRATPSYITWWITYDQWAAIVNKTIDSSTHDLAAIKLIESVAESIIPALLSPDANDNLLGMEAIMAGWGRLETDIVPHVLHAVNVTIISNADCQNLAYILVQQYLNINERYICTLAEPPALMHKGDSGGPLFFGSFILGISYATCPKTDNPIDRRKANLYCSVDYFRDFIEYNMHI